MSDHHIFPGVSKLMGNEERRLTCWQARCVDNTFCQRLHWEVSTCQRICKRPAFQLSIADCSDTAHCINKTIIVISFSFQNKMTRSALLNTQIVDTLLAFVDTPGTTQTFGARLTVDAVSSIAISPSAEFDTPSVKRAATLPSPHKLAVTDLAQEVAKELFNGGFTFLFVKFLNIYIHSKSD